MKKKPHRYDCFFTIV